MHHPLVPCPSCRRHVRAAETACPFCAAALPSDHAAAAVPNATARMSRAAMVAFTTSLALAGCGSTVTSADASGADSPPADTTTPADTRPSDTGADTGRDTGMDAPEDTGNVAPPYGVPVDTGPAPTDAAQDTAEDLGGIMPLYGGPTPRDAGPDADPGA